MCRQRLTFYHDKLGFEITYQGPEQNDIFFGIVQRGQAMIMFKTVGIEPMPNHTQDIGKGKMHWDAYIYVPDPDAWPLKSRPAMSNFMSR